MKTKKGIKAKVDRTLAMLEEEFQILTSSEQREIIGGSNGFLYEETWNADHTLMTPMVSFDGGSTWGRCDEAFNTAGMTSNGGQYDFSSSNAVGDDWFNSLGNNASSNFLNAFVDVLDNSEGGFQYTNNPNDNGGSTYAGITLSAFTNGGWAQEFGLSADVTGLKSMNTDQVAQVYQYYWDTYAHGDQINNTQLGKEIFDISFNGQANAGHGIQQALISLGYNVADDGVIGSQTVTAINQALSEKGASALGNAFNQQMTSIYENIAANDPSQQSNLQGWLNRVNKYSW